MVNGIGEGPVVAGTFTLLDVPGEVQVIHFYAGVSTTHVAFTPPDNDYGYGRTSKSSSYGALVDGMALSPDHRLRLDSHTGKKELAGAREVDPEHHGQSTVVV